jgi:S1/P1 Nuclease
VLAVSAALCRLLLLTLGLFGSCSAVAWGPQGHRTVGAIADQLLTPGTHARLAQLLAGDLDKFGNPSGRTTLEEVSEWADELHGTPGAHGPWHYDDMPICGREPKEGYCRDGQCNSEQLKRLIGVLGDPRASARARNEALKWVVHLVGDLHQPLHAADNDDRGGNEVHVALAGLRTRGRVSLHKAWDSDLVQQALNVSNRQQPPADIAALAGEAQLLVREAGQGTPDSWALESNNLARNVVYRYAGFACNSRPNGIIVLDRPYIDEAQALVRERLLLAGGRLANLLNQTLAAH